MRAVNGAASWRNSSVSAGVNSALAAGVRLLIAAGLITVRRAVLRCLANMSSSRTASGLRMYDDDAWVGGARERASRCRRPGFPPESPNGVGGID